MQNNSQDSARREPKVRCSAWLERGLLWLAKRDMRKAQERMESAEEILRMTGRVNAASEARCAIHSIKETADWVRPRSNAADQRPGHTSGMDCK
jgi:hypothetical protein